MALDGFVISNLVYELNDKLTNGRIVRISQPEKDELMIQIKKERNSYNLFLSANATLPLIYLAKDKKQNPANPPGFCMLLRKHLNNSKILSIEQVSLERIIRIKIEHFDELGDLAIKYLIIEIMGKHSNIIFCDHKDMIIDSIKHVSHALSSLREVLPGRNYFQPETIKKMDPFSISLEDFKEEVLTKSLPLFKAIYTSITGFSPLMANELCNLASLDSSIPARQLSQDEALHLYKNYERLMERVLTKDYSPNIIYKDDIPVEFSCFSLSIYENYDLSHHPSISDVLESFYAKRNNINHIKQKSSDLRRVLANTIERTSKKLDLQLKQMKDTQKREKFRIYGELINAYGYDVDPSSKSFTAINYYNGEEVKIPLDPNLTMQENAQKHFDKYNKLKRTYQALSSLIVSSKEELKHLESINANLEIAVSEEDLMEIRQELMDYGYIKKRKEGKKKNKRKNISKPFHFVSSDGFHIYVGKNNYQNDELTFKIASNNDWWFHAKNIPGSHVIVKSDGKDIPESTLLEAASLAAYYSKGRESGKVEIDYTQRKNIKKPKGGKPGFVVYYTNSSLVAPSSIKGVKEVI